METRGDNVMPQVAPFIKSARQEVQMRRPEEVRHGGVLADSHTTSVSGTRHRAAATGPQ